MPTSSDLGKSEIVEWVRKNEPTINRIMDIGAGNGTYPVLFKNNNQLCLTAEWVAVEAWEPYISQFKLDTLYDKVIHQDIRLLDWSTLGKFDLVIAGDVLEHMTKDEAITLVDKIVENGSTLIISIPVCFCPQDVYAGNPFEIHVKDDWTDEEVTSTWGHYIKEKYIGSVPRKRDVPFNLGVYWLSK